MVSLKMGDVGGGNGSMNNYNTSHQDWDSNNGDVISGSGFINIHMLSQFTDSITFIDMNGDVKNGDFNSRSGSMNIHTVY